MLALRKVSRVGVILQSEILGDRACDAGAR